MIDTWAEFREREIAHQNAERRRYFEQLVRLYPDNITETAKAVDMNRALLYRMIHALGVTWHYVPAGRKKERLDGLTEQQVEDLNTLKERGGYSHGEALAIVTREPVKISVRL